MTSFDYKIIRLLPRNWVSSFRAYEALEFFDVDDFVSMTYNHLSLEQTQSIMKVCIKSSCSEEVDDDIPYKVLKVIKSQKRDIDKIARSIKELEKVRIIQQAWKAWKKYQYIQAIKKIQRW
ncbi:11917_t:CDS:2, partial [Funneliformis geosporum]